MPWQAQIFVGKRVRNLQDLYDIGQELNMDFETIEEIAERFNDKEIVKDERLYATDNFPQKEIEFEYKDEKYIETAEFLYEVEGGSTWPEQLSFLDEEYTDALFGFEITSRYSAGVLNQKGGRTEPFALDLEGMISIRDQVREVWPSAEVYVWDNWY